MATIRQSIERVRAFARAQGWTKSRLAREAGMIDTTLRDFHRDDWNPTAETIRRLEAVIPEDFEPGETASTAASSQPPAEGDIDSGLVRKLASLLEETGLSEIEYGAGDWHLRVARNAAPAAAAPGTASVEDEVPPAAGSEPFIDDPGALLAPMVGIVYTAPEPGAPPFVKVGDAVSEGQPVLMIEAMKVFNQIAAPRTGKVTRILISNGTPVEYGEALMIIE